MKLALTVVVVVACAGCGAADLLGAVPISEAGGVVELGDEKQVLLRVDPTRAPQRFFLPVDTVGRDLGAVVDVVADVDAPFQLIVAGRPEETSASLPWSIVEDDLRLSFDLDDVSGARLPGVELGVAAKDDAVDVALLLQLRVASDDASATAAFGPLEPHAP